MKLQVESKHPILALVLECLGKPWDEAIEMQKLNQADIKWKQN
jgi:hypothetical protein